MQLQKFIGLILLIIFSGMFLVQCGSDPAEEGEKAFQSANYNMAIKLFSDARRQSPDNQLFKERIAISYMYRGQELFGKTKNIKSFSGNFEKGSNYIPDEPSAEFKKNYSKVLYTIAKAYTETKPQNDIEKEEFLNKAIGYLEEATFQDETNTDADTYLAQIKEENFQKMLDRGQDFFKKAKRTKNYDLYFSAEYYFKKAAYFDIHNEQAQKMLSKTREQTLSILNNRDDLAMAIPDYLNQAGVLIIDLVMRNFTRDAIDISLDKFELVDLDGNTYAVDKTTLQKKFKGKQLKDSKLGELKDLSGFLAFKVDKKVKIEHLAYKYDDDTVFKKYFP